MTIYRFETFSLDSDRVELRRGTGLVDLEPQVYDLLLYLIRNRDRTASKDELIATVWRGRVVSESTVTSRITAARHAIGDTGPQQRLIRTVHRKGYRFVGTVQVTESALNKETASFPPALENFDQHEKLPAGSRSIHPKPAIAVLPFANLCADRGVGYFIDGVVEEIMTALSRFPWLAVTGRCSINRRFLDVRTLHRELGTRYVVEGSVRRDAERVRITARLIDADTGALVWAGDFGGRLGNTLDLQKRVTASVVGAMVPRLEQSEIERIKRKPTACLDAYELYLRAMSSVFQWTEAGMREALAFLHRAIDSDADFAPAYGMAAYCYVQRKSYGWFTDQAHEMAECSRLAQQAAELGKEDASVLSRAALALAYVVGDVEGGRCLVEQACRACPNLSLAWYVSGWVRVYLGQPDVAIEHLMKALRLSPSNPLAFKMHAGIAYAHMFAERYDEACVSVEKAVRARPNYLTGLRGAAASYAFAGRVEEAGRLISHLRKLDSRFRISGLDELFPLRRSSDSNLWVEGLRKAGLPS